MLKRIITALILVAIVLSCMFASTDSYLMWGLMGLFTLGAGYEWYKLMPQAHHDLSQAQTQAQVKTKAWLFGIVLTLIVLIALIVIQNIIWLGLWLIALPIWLVVISWVRRFPQDDSWYRGALLPLGGILIVSAVTAIFYLWSCSPWWLLYVFLLVWGADSGAYFVGRKFGKHKLAPEVSPNKSREGLYGGLLTSFLIMVAVAYYLNFPLPLATGFIILSLLTVVASVYGDLFESMVKRRAGIKDSGTILPGHGGILDRVDSLLSAMPLFAAGMMLMSFTTTGAGLIR